MPQLLLELLSEEIPARMQANAARDLERMMRERLAAEGLLPEALTAFAGPRRLTLVAEGLPLLQPDRHEELKGPRTSAPAPALDGFLRKTGLSRDQLVEKDGVWFATLERPGKPTPQIIAAAVEHVVRNFPWPKSMVWGVSKLRWVRPLRRILCVFDGEIVPFVIEGIESGDTTEGHRFMGSGQPFKVRNFETYAAQLAAHYVVLDVEERKSRILELAGDLCYAKSSELIEDPELLEEVAGLVEWPIPVIGDIDPAFLDLPPELIRTTMRVHQRYFAVRHAPSGSLNSYFLAVANVHAKDGGATIARGNSKVLSARLADAKFFLEQDQKVTLEDRLDDLRWVTFHSKLGTLYGRVLRIEGIVEDIAEYFGENGVKSKAAQAAKLCKADLVSGVVREFPELQGIIGAYYAEYEGIDKDVVGAIREHYRPQGPGDAVPTAPVAAAVAVADKLDILISFFAIGEKPTGSRDPFALRRAALGVIRILLANGVRLPLRRAIVAGLQRLVHMQANFVERARPDISVQDREFKWWKEIQAHYQDVHRHSGDPNTSENLKWFRSWIWETKEVTELYAVNAVANGCSNPNLKEWDERAADTTLLADIRRFYSELTRSPGQKYYDKFADDLLAFFADRLKVQLRDEGQRHDLVDAVFALGDDDLVRIVARVQALAAFLTTDDGANLLAGYKRAVNILKAEEKKGPLPTGAPAPARPEPEEAALIGAVEAVEGRIAQALAGEDFTAAMAALATLRAPVDAFFDKVLVNSDVPEERDNRLRLLAKVKDAMGQVADFSQITG